MKRIDEILPTVLNQLGLTSKFMEYQVLRIWQDVVGDKIARHTKVKCIQRGTLYVKVGHPVWRQELMMLKDEIKAQLNNRLGHEVVKRITILGG